MRNQAGMCDLRVNGNPHGLDWATLSPHLALCRRISLSIPDEHGYCLGRNGWKVLEKHRERRPQVGLSLHGVEVLYHLPSLTASAYTDKVAQC